MHIENDDSSQERHVATHTTSIKNILGLLVSIFSKKSTVSLSKILVGVTLHRLLIEMSTIGSQNLPIMLLDFASTLTLTTPMKPTMYAEIISTVTS